MDTIIFVLLTATVWLLFRNGDRKQTLIWWAVSFVVIALFLKYHVSDPLKLNF